MTRAVRVILWEGVGVIFVHISWPIILVMILIPVFYKAIMMLCMEPPRCKDFQVRSRATRKVIRQPRQLIVLFLTL